MTQRERDRLRSERWRRAHGIMPRRPAHRPWQAEGISRIDVVSKAGKGHAEDLGRACARASRRQAVMGVVEAPGGGVQPKSGNQVYGSKTTAKTSQLALRAVAQSSLWSEDAEGDTLSVSSDAERPLPDTRRPIAGRSEGE
jgi:hypothetical protein